MEIIYKSNLRTKQRGLDFIRQKVQLKEKSERQKPS